MTIENLINEKGLGQLSNNELKKIGKTLNKDEEPINEFFCEIQEILTDQNISKCGDLENLILMTTRAYIESTAIKAMELKI